MKCPSDVLLRVWLLLKELRENEEPARFGYRLQGLFVHTLLRLGAGHIKNNPRGHPDVVCRYGGVDVMFEVELLSPPQFIDPENVLAIKPDHPGIKGFLALFQLVYPPRWIIVEHGELKRLAGTHAKTSRLLARRDRILSEDVSVEFISLVVHNEHRLANLNFRLLNNWAMRGVVI